MDTEDKLIALKVLSKKMEERDELFRKLKKLNDEINFICNQIKENLRKGIGFSNKN